VHGVCEGELPREGSVVRVDHCKISVEAVDGVSDEGARVRAGHFAADGVEYNEAVEETFVRLAEYALYKISPDLPFDVQVCKLIVGTLRDSAQEVTFRPLRGVYINRNSADASVSEWRLERYYGQPAAPQEYGSTDTESLVIFKFHLARVSDF
jgi:hypothetical protein